MNSRLTVCLARVKCVFVPRLLSMIVGFVYYSVRIVSISRTKNAMRLIYRVISSPIVCVSLGLGGSLALENSRK